MESNEAQLTLHDQLLTWLVTHKKEVIWGSTAVVAIGLIAGITITYRNAREENANIALSKAFNVSMAGPSAEPLLKVASDYQGTAAGIRAQLMGAEALFDAGKYTEAKALFEGFLKDHRDTPYVSQASFGVAVCLQAQNQTNEAIKAFDDVLKRHSNDNVAPRARLALANYYLAQDKLPQAKEYYEQLLGTSANNSSVRAEASLRMQELYTRNPELFQPKNPEPAPVPPGTIIAPETTTGTSSAPAITLVPAAAPAATNQP
jgi:TolA-binding protein